MLTPTPLRSELFFCLFKICRVVDPHPFTLTKVHVPPLSPPQGEGQKFWDIGSFEQIFQKELICDTSLTKGLHLCQKANKNQTYHTEIEGPPPDMERGHCVHLWNSVGEGLLLSGLGFLSFTFSLKVSLGKAKKCEDGEISEEEWCKDRGTKDEAISQASASSM